MFFICSHSIRKNRSLPTKFINFMNFFTWAHTTLNHIIYTTEPHLLSRSYEHACLRSLTSQDNRSKAGGKKGKKMSASNSIIISIHIQHSALGQWNVMRQRTSVSSRLQANEMCYIKAQCQYMQSKSKFFVYPQPLQSRVYGRFEQRTIFFGLVWLFDGGTYFAVLAW